MEENSHPGATQPTGTGSAADSLDLILSHARQTYQHQVVTLEAYRARAVSLLAVAAVLVTFAGAGPYASPSVTHAVGTVCVLVSAVFFLLVSSARGFRAVPSLKSLTGWPIGEPVRDSKMRLLRHTLVGANSNRRELQLFGSLLTAGLVCLLVGTILIGARLALLLL